MNFEREIKIDLICMLMKLMKIEKKYICSKKINKMFMYMKPQQLLRRVLARVMSLFMYICTGSAQVLFVKIFLCF